MLHCRMRDILDCGDCDTCLVLTQSLPETSAIYDVIAFNIVLRPSRACKGHSFFLRHPLHGYQFIITQESFSCNGLVNPKIKMKVLE